MSRGGDFKRRRLFLLLIPLAIYALTYMVIDQTRPVGVTFPHLAFLQTM